MYNFAKFWQFWNIDGLQIHMNIYMLNVCDFWYIDVLQMHVFVHISAKFVLRFWYIDGLQIHMYIFA